MTKTYDFNSFEVLANERDRGKSYIKVTDAGGRLSAKAFQDMERPKHVQILFSSKDRAVLIRGVDERAPGSYKVSVDGSVHAKPLQDVVRAHQAIGQRLMASLTPEGLVIDLPDPQESRGVSEAERVSNIINAEYERIRKAV